MLSKVFRLHKHGGPEELRLELLDVGEPGCAQVRLRVEANEASAGFELVKGWVNLDANSPAFVDSSGSMRQKKARLKDERMYSSSPRPNPRCFSRTC